jgi:hypothetical protein
MIHIYLADSRTGRVCAHGLTTWPTRFVAGTQAMIDRHLAGPQDDAAAGAEFETLLRASPGPGVSI